MDLSYKFEPGELVYVQQMGLAVVVSHIVLRHQAWMPHDDGTLGRSYSINAPGYEVLFNSELCKVKAGRCVRVKDDF